MYSVMIVDDEKAIREYLPKIINFEEYGFMVCATAKNGAEALQKVEEFMPQLIILDVCMPVMDGIAFLKKLRQDKTDYNPCIIMLSGYNEFEYARAAIRYGVKDYLTKPVDEVDVGAILTEMRTELDSRLQQQDSTELYNKVRYLKELYHNGDGDRSKFENHLVMHCVMLQAATWQEENYQVIRKCIEEGKHSGKTRLFRSRGSVFSYLVSRRVLEDYQNSITLFGRHILYQIKKSGVECALLFDDCLFGKSTETFRNDYDAHLYQMLTEVFWKKELLLQSSQCMAGIYEHRMEKEDLYIEKLKKAIAENDGDMAKQVFDDIVCDCNELKLNLVILQEINYRIYYTLQEVLGEQWHENIRPIDWRDDTYLICRQGWEKALWEQFEGALQSMERRRKQYGSGMVDNIIEYANQHYKEQLSLKELADLFFVNPSYLGRSFQKVTRASFKQYLNNLRIEEAKALLANTDKMVYEIAEEVGFTESKYFVSKFTAQVGKTPLEYRKMMQSSEENR